MTEKPYKKGIFDWRKEISAEVVSKPFRKRRYHNPKEFLDQCWYLAPRIKNLPLVLDVAGAVVRGTFSTNTVNHHKHSELMSPQFRERLMLAVTSVNGCHACSYAHARAALTEGLDEHEIDLLLSGHFEDCPKEEQAALLYAQHWAEHEGKPDKLAREKVLEIYGERKLSAIEFTLGSIRIGNYIGNTVEYFEHKLRTKKLLRLNEN